MTSAIDISLGLSGEPLSPDLPAYFPNVGIIKSEYICKYLESYVTNQSCQEGIYQYVCHVARLWSKGEVWYRFIEMTVREVNRLKQADHILEDEVEDAGLRGVRRSLTYPETFRIELDILKQVTSQYPNVHLLMPFVTDVSEIEGISKLVSEAKISSKMGAMIETPAAALCVEELICAGLDNVTIGLNDLTFFTMASMKSSPLYDRRHPAVTKLVESVISCARRHCVQSNLTGYLDRDVFDHYYIRCPDRISVFYHNAPSIISQLASLPHLNHWRKVKFGEHHE